VFSGWRGRYTPTDAFMTYINARVGKSTKESEAGRPPSIPGPSPKRPSLRTSVWGFYRCRAPDPVFFHKDNVSVLRELRHGASEAAAGTPSAAWGEHLGVSICRRARSAKTPGVRSNSWNAPSCSLHPFSSTIMRSVPHTVLSRWAITRRVDRSCSRLLLTLACVRLSSAVVASSRKTNRGRT